MNKLMTASILSFVAAAVAVAVRALGFIDDSIMIILIGLLGFSGLAELRLFIDSKGIKTFVVIGAGALGIIGLATGAATPEAVAYWFSAFGIISGATLVHAVQKSKK